jgi:hypothetical protein
MGSYTSLSLNNKTIFTTKSYVPYYFNQIFKLSDIRIVELNEDGNLITSEDELIEENRWLVITANALLDRLALIGYTDERVKVDFEKYVGNEISEIQSGDSVFKDEPKIQEAELKFWKHATLESFGEAAKKLLNNEYPDANAEKYIESLGDPLLYMIFQSHELMSSIPFSNFFTGLRFLLNLIPSDSFVIQDYTEIYNAGWVNDDDVLDENSFSKTLILAEGKSDIDILQTSLALLYPHLYEYFSFFDFDGYNNEGGAGNLVKLLKAFAGAGIKNNIIGIFDNDAAAIDSQSVLKNFNLPSNIKVFNYPELALAANYPTIGPTGIHCLNINGLACSIELYLGIDVLQQENGDFYPIQWKGYIPKLNSYQGEVTYKKAIQDRFQNKLNSLKQDPTIYKAQDWEGLHAIFRLIFSNYEEVILND